MAADASDREPEDIPGMAVGPSYHRDVALFAQGLKQHMRHGFVSDPGTGAVLQVISGPVPETGGHVVLEMSSGGAVKAHLAFTLFGARRLRQLLDEGIEHAASFASGEDGP